MGIYDNKTAVVTGGSSGIGLATAQLLASQGARVLITGRDRKALEAAVATLGERALFLQSDATSSQDIAALFDKVKDAFGGLDLLFLNAGGGGFTPFEQTPEAIYDEVMALNAKAPYFMAQTLVPLLRAGSAIIFTTSGANVKGSMGLSVYGGAKAALRSFARTLAVELLPRGIRVNAVSPGPIDTPVIEKGKTKEEADQMRKLLPDMIPMKRLGRSDEVAKAVLFLAFEATFTTGAEIPVDGGLTQL